MLFAQGIDSIETVLAIRAKAVQALRDGGTVTSWNVEGSSVTKLVNMRPQDIIQECNAFLRLVMPDIYGRRVKRTIPVFL